MVAKFFLQNYYIMATKQADLEIADNLTRYNAAYEFEKHHPKYKKGSFSYKDNPYMKTGYCQSHFCVDELSSRDKILKETLHGSGELTVPIEKQQLLQKAQGWWADTINCEQNSAHNLYCKPKEKWIWPY